MMHFENKKGFEVVESKTWLLTKGQAECWKPIKKHTEWSLLFSTSLYLWLTRYLIKHGLKKKTTLQKAQPSPKHVKLLLFY